MRQRVNVKDPETGKRRAGNLNPETNQVLLSNGKMYDLEQLEKIDKNGVGFFETRSNGTIIQKFGKFLGL